MDLRQAIICFVRWSIRQGTFLQEASLHEIRSPKDFVHHWVYHIAWLVASTKWCKSRIIQRCMQKIIIISLTLLVIFLLSYSHLLVGRKHWERKKCVTFEDCHKGSYWKERIEVFGVGFTNPITNTTSWSKRVVPSSVHISLACM